MILLYLITDYLIDQKELLDKLDSLYSEERDFSKKAEIKERRTYVFHQTLQAISRFDLEIPKEMQDYFFNKRDKPEIREYLPRMKKVYINYDKIKKTFRKIVIICIIIVSILFLVFL